MPRWHLGSSEICASTFLVCDHSSCVIHQPEATRDCLKSCWWVGGRLKCGKMWRAPVLHHLGKCLLIPAKKPGCFVVDISQYTAAAPRSIIQKESCGYLMLCCRVVFSVHFALHSSLSFLLWVFFLPYLELCGVSFPLILCVFKKKRQDLLRQNSTLCVCVCVGGCIFRLQVVLQCRAAVAG